MTSEPPGTEQRSGRESPFMCSFCLRSREETGLLVGAPTAAICRACAAGALVLFEESPSRAQRPLPASPWEALTDDQLLERIPQVAQAREQVEDHLRRWVGVARDRGISWAAIGQCLGMSRQSAWERFRQARPAGD
jgi:hypothetical protein